MATQPLVRISEREYLDRDRANEFRSEYIGGEMVAMSGGTLRHSRLISRCAFVFESELDGGNCSVFSSDTRVRTSASGAYVYPDMSVVCGPAQVHLDCSDILVNPVLVAEVLSPSTRSYDQAGKFALYREIPTLREYLLVHSDSACLTLYSRQPDDSWDTCEASGLEASLTIPSFPISLKLAAIYQNAMDFPG